MAGMPPRALAEKIVALVESEAAIDKVEIAGPGFINFFVNDSAKFAVVEKVLAEQADFGRCNVGEGKSVLVEFVSANPTGPLHVGHGRGAAYGASVSNLLSVAGFNVSKEYYVNDAGRQMDILATSVWLRYLSQCGAEFAFPSNGYKGDYIYEISDALKAQFGTDLVHPIEAVFSNVRADEGQEDGDKEKHIDDLIVNAKSLLGAAHYEAVFSAAVDSILSDIKQDLSGFGVTFEQWFSERALMDTGVIDAAIEKLQAAELIKFMKRAVRFGSVQQTTAMKKTALWSEIMALKPILPQILPITLIN